MADGQGQDLLDQVASQPQQPAPTAPAQAPSGGDLLDQVSQESKGASSGSIAEGTKSWWDTASSVFNEGLLGEAQVFPGGPTFSETGKVASAVMDKIVQHEVASAHPYRAQIASFFKGSSEDSAKFLNSLTSPVNVGMAILSGGESILAKSALTAANLYFAYRGGHELLAERQENETTADVIERRLMGAAGMIIAGRGATGEAGDVAKLQRQRIQNKLGISGDLANKVNQKVTAIDAVRQAGAKDASGMVLRSVQEAGDILDQAAAERGQPAIEPAVDTAARYAGVMPEGELGDFYRFRDGVTGGALSIRKSDLSPDALKQQVAQQRKDIAPPKPDDDPLLIRSRQEKQQRVQDYLASTPKGTGAAGALEEAQAQIPIRMGQIVKDAAHAVYSENARVSKPFEEMAANAKTPVSDSQSVRATIVDTVKAHGVQDAEIPPRVFAALFKQGKGSNEWMDIPKGPISQSIPDFQEGLQEVNKPVSFSDLTRVRGDLYDAAQASGDPVVKNGLFDAYDSITKMQEKYADMNNFGDKYRAAKEDYKNFKRELGSGLMSDFLKAEDYRQQAMTPKLAKIMTGRDMEAMRGLLKMAGVDVSPLDEMIAQRNQASKVLAEGGKGAAKQATTVLKAGQKAAQAKTAATEKEATALGKQGSVIPGVSDLTLKGKTTEQIRREAIERIATNAKQAGISNPMGMFMLVYGTIRLGLGSFFGGYIAARGGSAVLKNQGARLLRNPSYQDWIIRESGVDPSNTKLIGKMRQGLSALAKTSTGFSKVPPKPDEDQQ